MALVDQLPPEPVRSGDDAELIHLRAYANEGEAFIAKSVLEVAGIDAMVSAGPEHEISWSRSFGIGLPGTHLYVRSEDFVIANEILTKVEKGSE